MANSYSYDEYGNRTGAVLGGTAVSYTYDKNNRLTKESATAGGTTTDVLYQYDPNGNRVSVVTSSVTTEQAGTAGISLELPQLETVLNRYDAFGRLVESEITKDGARTLAQYTYNASGYRTSKTVNGVTTEHVLDGANVAADVANGQVTQYVRGLGLTALVQADGTRLQYVTDGHGDVKKLISGSGAVVADYTYDAFGNQTSETEDSNPFRYSGEYYDAETGLIYLRARYYDSGVGVFVSEDTHWNVGNMIYGDNNTGTPSIAAILQSGNLYLYCMGNPVTYWDPSGNSARITLGSLQSALEQGVSAFEIRDAYYLQVGSNSLAVEYAKNHNPQYVDGKLKTWANEADAYRHFTWNYKMVKKMNYDKALKISSAHEIAFLREHKVIVYVTDSSSTLRNAFMTLENLMDIWNNSRAVDAAASGMYSSAEAAFQALLNNGDLITSPDQVAAKYGFDPSKMTTGINNINGFNVTLDYKNGYLYSGSIWLQGTRRQ